MIMKTADRLKNSNVTTINERNSNRDKAKNVIKKQKEIIAPPSKNINVIRTTATTTKFTKKLQTKT